MPTKANQEKKRLVLFIVGLNCDDPSREVEFNKWYDEIHLKEALQHPGFVSGSRYEIINPNDGYPKYIAIYELESEEAFKVFDEDHKKRAAGLLPPMTPGPPRTIVWWAGYKPI